MTWEQSSDLYRRYVNPEYVDLLELLDYGRSFVRAKGTGIFDDEGNRYLDFLAGFGVHNLGHNPDSVVEALKSALGSDSSSMLNIDAPVAVGRLAERLTGITHRDLCRTVFASSGAESVEIAIRAARAATGRSCIVTCRNGFHGFTTGALALMGNDEIKAPFGALLPDVIQVPFGDIEALRETCRRKQPAAFFVEPIQGEGGIVVPGPTYLADAHRICCDSGCLLVVDEIQTGFGRTGRVFATEFSQVVPDILLLGKALGGGLIPVAATMMTVGVWKRAFGGPEHCLLDASTCSGGMLAMTAGLAVISAIEDKQLVRDTVALGDRLMRQLQGLAARHDVIKDVRGRGLLIGVEFRQPSGLLARLVPERSREGLYAHVIAARLLHEHRIVVQPCSLAKAVLRIEPPLVVGTTEVDCFVEALDETITACPSHNSAAVAAVRRTVLGGEL